MVKRQQRRKAKKRFVSWEAEIFGLDGKREQEKRGSSFNMQVL
jgi:hypothetical protein